MRMRGRAAEAQQGCLARCWVWPVAETVALTVLGTLAAVVLLILTRELLAWWRPAFPVLLTTGTIAQTAAAAAAMALLAAWLPAHRLSRLDAASAFRSGR